MLKIKTNKEKFKAFFENVLCSLPLLSMMTPGAGWAASLLLFS